MVLVVAALLGSVIGYNLYKQQKIDEFLANRPPPTFPVTTMEVTPTTWQPSLPAYGFIEPYQGVYVSSEVPGTVTAIDFESGQQVKKGDLLVELDSDVEKANLRSAEARLPAVERNMKRMRRLYEQGSVSEGTRDEALAEFLSLRAEIEALRATIERRQIRAPFDGVTGIRNVYLGDYVQPGMEIVRLENNETMRLRFAISQNELSQVHVGQTVEVSVDAYPDAVFNGEITALGAAVNFRSGMVEIQADVPNQDGVLRSGMFARLEILLPEMQNQVVLPQTAINFTLYGESVFVVQQPETENESGEEGEEGEEKAKPTVQQVTVKVAERKGNLARLAEGIEMGQEVVTSGQLRLSNGSRIEVKQSDALTPPDDIPAL
nr:MexH family multidrug efflux RND transporter periplasmic adaptor subunit [bacterium]